MTQRRTVHGWSLREWWVVALVIGMVAPATVGLTANPAAAAPAVTVVSSMRNVRPDQPVPPGTAAASITAARNEFESFQVVISGGGQTLTNVNVALTTPIGNVPASNVTIYREEYVNATEASDDEGATGRWGDALIPEVDPIYGENRTAFPIPSIPSTENRVAWVDVLVPLGHPAGSFTGAITVTADGGFTRTVPVDLQVLNLDLPSTSTLDSAFFMYLNGPCRQLTGTSNCGGDAELTWKLGTLYARVALENRMTIANPAPLGGSLTPAASGVNNERFQRYFVPLTDGGTLQPPAGHTPWSAIRLAGAKMTRVGIYGYTDYSCLQTCTERWKQEATAHGFADRTFLYACDEPHLDTAKWDGCDTYNQQAKAGWPEVPFEVTASLAETNWRYGAGTNPVKLHVPNVIFLDSASRAAYDTWLTTPGNELWLYTACDSFGCGASGETNPTFDGLPGYAIDAPAVQHRASSLLAYKYRISGELYYDTLRYGCDDLYGGCGGTATFGANGDGVLFYPGLACTTPSDKRCIGGTNPIPIESVRMKRFRDGQEDYEYLHYLATHGLDSQARSVVDAFLPDARSATPDKDAGYDAMRGQLIDLLESIVGTGATGKIAYASAAPGCPGTMCIWTMNADGTGKARLTSPPPGSEDRFPSISPDGSHVAFTRVTGSDADLWVVDIDGVAPTLLLGGATRDEKPAWSPDGDQLVFVRGASPSSDLYKMTRTTGWQFGAPTALLVRAGDDFDPAWSGDGAGIVFASGAAGANGWDIRRVTAAGGSEQLVTGGVAGDDDNPSWSHDNAKVALDRTTGGAYDIYVVNANGTSPVNATPGTAATSEFQPVFSPDDAELLYVSTADGDQELVVDTIGGGSPTPLTSNGVTDRDPDWVDPDGSQVAPSPPRSVAAVGGDASATVTWQAPLHDGGSARTGYTVTAQPGGKTVDVGPAATSAVVPGLADGTYTFTVVAKNALGPSLPAVSNQITTTKPGFHPMTPARVLDSRDGTGGFASPWPSGGTRNLDLGATVPASATAVVLNVTVTGATAPSHLTVWPKGETMPTASNLNFVAGQTVPNLVVVKLGTGDDISIFNNAGTAHVIADVAGWFDDGVASTGAFFTGVTPTRVLDSRDGTGGFASPWPSGGTRNLDLGATVPASATAVVLNVTVTGATAPSHLTVWPTGETMPTASNLNFVAGQTVPNLVVVKLGTGDDVSIFNNAGTAHVIADVVGYFQPTTGGGFHGLTPTRIVDSRDGTGGFATPWGSSQSRLVQVAGVAGVPSTAKAVVVNATVTGPTAPSHLTVYPSGGAVPLASNLNFVTGQTVPNLVMVKLGGDGKIGVFNNAGSTHVILDVVGWYQ